METINLSEHHFNPIMGGADNQVFVKSRKFMRGSGLFSSIGSFLLPILKSVGRYLFSQGSTLVGDASSSLIEGKNFKDSVKSAAQKTVTRIGNDIKNKVGGRATVKRLQKKPKKQQKIRSYRFAAQ
jgi:hypothetical protein